MGKSITTSGKKLHTKIAIQKLHTKIAYIHTLLLVKKKCIHSGSVVLLHKCLLRSSNVDISPKHRDIAITEFFEIPVGSIDWP